MLRAFIWHGFFEILAKNEKISEIKPHVSTPLDMPSYLWLCTVTQMYKFVNRSQTDDFYELISNIGMCIVH